MAPILSTAIGVTPQIIDDPRLRQILAKLNALEPKKLLAKQPKSPQEVIAPLDISQLVALLEPYSTWIFEEQVDLHEWINALNAIDACLSYFIQKYPSLLLIGPVKRKRGRGGLDAEQQLLSRPAESMEDVASVPNEGVKDAIKIILRFLSCLIRDSSSKAIFNSVEELVDLLAAADDTIASLALEVLCNLATPPSLHKQQAPELNQHTTGLHSSKTASHRRLIALARGWGTRGSGLGLFTCVTADDSEFGQGSLPSQAGDLEFTFSANAEQDNTSSAAMEEAPAIDPNADFELVRIHLSAAEIMKDEEPDQNATMDDAEMADADTNNDTAEGSKKRRRVGPVGSKTKLTKSTAELFFLCLQKAGGRSKIPEERLFALLADIRLAKSFYCSGTRVEAVERRLRALIAILHAHPSQEIMSGYFQAQPELCVELIDLLRPTVSSANISSTKTASVLSQDALGALSTSPSVPYDVRMLAVEALTALVARRDGTTGGLTGAARHSSVLNELGVGKGQYLGLLPTLIRYSLASLGSSFSGASAGGDGAKTTGLKSDAEQSLDVGLAFVEATMAPAIPRIVQLERALEFIDAVLTLTSAIVSTPTGTSALTECGLIPALLTTVSTDSQHFIEQTLPNASSYSTEQILRVQSLLRFITAQAIQILEGAIVTHNNALSAFHDLQGVEVLTSRLSREVSETRNMKVPARAGLDTMEVEQTLSSDTMDVEEETKDGNHTKQRILSSQRVLLFSIVTCLTVVFHQESASSTATAPSGGAQLRKEGLSLALINIMDDVNSYGGHLASLIATLLSDVLNSDPHVVHHVHKSGIAKSFLNMLIGKQVTASDGSETYEPILPPVPELIMALPNVISALALTEDGAKAVKEANPFPSMLKLFRHPKYAMPNSRCLLNEMTAIVGTGLDEVMRHVQMLKPLVLKAIADALNEIVVVAEDLTKREEGKLSPTALAGKPATDIENERSCLMQYVLNFGQLLEQILHNEDHCEPFVAAGGLDALLKLFPLVMPSGHQFLSHCCSLSCPSVSTLHHSTAEESLCLAYKCISMRYDPLKLIKTTVETVKLHVEELEEAQMALRHATCSHSDEADIVRVDAGFVLEGVPRKPLHQMSLQNDESILTALSRYLRAASNVQWATNLLSVAIKTACQRSQETGAGWSRTDCEWKKELTSKVFEELVQKLAVFHQSSIFEVCRIRSLDEYQALEQERAKAGKDRNMRYRLRIVCPEGAVVRDGIEIDSCASVGSMEMGEIAEAFDRCVNSSGILRYRTPRGWVSEMTRGHGREPIAEVISFWQADSLDVAEQSEQGSPPPPNKRRIEAPMSDMCSVSASVMARLQTSYSEFFNALSKAVIQGVRSLPATNVSFQEGDAGSHAAAVMKVLSSNVQKGFDRREVLAIAGISGNQSDMPPDRVNARGVAMYLGCILNQLLACLFEEKRERRMVNVPLLLFLMETDSADEQQSKLTLLDSVRFIFRQGLNDFELRVRERSKNLEGQSDNGEDKKPFQRIDRTVAASLPPAISLLRRMMSGALISSSPASSILSRMKRSDLALLLGRDINCSGFKKSDNDEALFSPEGFVKCLHFSVSEVVREIWVDPRFAFSPTHIVHPFATLVGDIISGLEDAGKKRQSSQSRAQGNSSQWDMFRGAVQARRIENQAPQEEFEPSEEAIARLEEMGFNRDQALDALESTRSNRVEIAMEYALSHPPPSPATIERRRAQREERRRRREERAAAANQDDQEVASEGAAGVEPAGDPAAAAPSNGAETNTGALDVDPSQNADAKDTKEGESEEKEYEDDDVARAKSLLRQWIKDAPKVSGSVLSQLSEAYDSGVGAVNMSNAKDVKGEGDGEREALAVVLCSFLLDLCQRYPDESNGIMTDLLGLLKSQIAGCPEGGYYVQEGKDASFAALCHAAVLFTSALPKTRGQVLKESLVHMMLSCVQRFLKSSGEQTSMYPTWMASAILLLEVMAQPVVAFSDEDKDTDGNKTDSDSKTEYQKVCEDHKKQSVEMTEVAARIFSAVETKDKERNTKEKAPRGKTKECGTSGRESKDEMTDIEVEGDSKDKKTEKSPAETAFASVPSYFPLLPSDVIDSCLEICLDLLRRGKNTSESSPAPPPGVVHSVLLLLLRLLRTPKLSTRCLQMGAAETILSLPYECRFTGNTGLTTLILRRLLEDEPTLQAAMETEIRSIVTKIHGKKDFDTETPKAPLSAFTQTVTPLLCRDPLSFLKAFILSVKLDSKEEPAVVTLISSEERARNVKALAEVFKTKKPIATPGKESYNKEKGGKESKKEDKSRRRSASLSRQRRVSDGHGKKSKSPSHRQTPAKRSHSSKKHKRDKNEEKHTPILNGTPANHIVSLLIIHIVSSCSQSLNNCGLTELFPNDKSFLWIANLLEILADLVLAVPACATAVQKYRPPRGKDRAGRHAMTTDSIVHALGGCPPPPKTFLSFLLHHILPQDRWSIRNDQQFWDCTKEEEADESEAVTTKKKLAFRLNKVSQTSARLLVALVARPGEGRKRVISELTFALSGGLLGHTSAQGSNSSHSKDAVFNARELHALQAWGELCIGLASPRSNGKSPEGNSSLSFEVIKLMLEHGMAHALLFAIHRVRLHHPMAANTCSALLLPFEILTRGSVTDGVQSLADKESSSGKASQDSGASKNADASTEADKSHETTVHTDEAMLEEAFHHEAAPEEPAANEHGFDLEERHDDEHEEDEDDVEMEEEIDDEGSAGDEEMSSSSDLEEDASSESDETDDDSDEDDDEDDETGSMIEDDEESEMVSSQDSQDMEQPEDGGDWNANPYREDMMAENQDFEDADDDDAGRNEGGLDEGWTRIEPNGFGGNLAVGGRRHGIVNNGPLTARTRGFIDAAEAMIGTLLRTGELDGPALAEIEGSLGIRIMSGGRSIRAISGGVEGDSVFADNVAARLGVADNRTGDSRSRSEVVGTLPHVHQRSQPGSAYSSLGGGGRWIETSSMEYVYGGPSITAGSRNYDIISPTLEEPENDAPPNISQMDLQLFPGGPASAAHARTQHSLHPLLCGVDLPPVNALVSDLLPHGVRSTRRGQMTTRRPGEWTNASFSSGNYLVLTSNGNIIRSNRAGGGAPLSLVAPSNRNVSGPVGWTDDGLPFDATAARFSSAFEGALRDSMVALTNATEAHERSNENGSSNDTQGRGNSGEAAAPVPAEGTDSAAQGNGGSQDRPSGDGEQRNAASGDSPQNNRNSSDGDGVASSLAAGLRLSPRSDASAASTEPMSAPAEAAANAEPAVAGPSGDATMEDTAADYNNAEVSQDVTNGNEDGVADMDVQPESEGTRETEREGGDGAATAAAEEQASQNSGQLEAASAANPSEHQPNQRQPNNNGFICPPDFDEEAFNALPVELQREYAEQHQANQDLVQELDAGSSLDPDALAALPPEIRREVIEQERNERRAREAPADPSNAEEMDNASFLASLAPELREEILLTADETFITSLPPNIIAEAQILRERAAQQQRRMHDDPVRDAGGGGNAAAAQGGQRGGRDTADTGTNASSRRKSRSGKLRVEKDRDQIVYIPPGSSLTPPVAKADLKALLRLLYLLAPVRPARLLQKVFQNLCSNPNLRNVIAAVFVKLLHEDDLGALAALDSMSRDYADEESGWRKMVDGLFADPEFPPKYLLGAVPEVLDTEAFNPNITLLRRKQGNSTAASIAANLPTSAACSRREQQLPPVVATRVVDSLLHLCKNSPRFCLHSLVSEISVLQQLPESAAITCFDKILDLLEKPRILKSSANLEQLLTLLEACVTPLSHLSKHGEDKVEVSQREIDAATSAGKVWVDVPRVVVSQERLQLLCSILRMETCRDVSFTKVNTIVRRLCRIDANRGCVLAELASVAHALGADAIRDLKALRIRMDSAVAFQKTHQEQQSEEKKPSADEDGLAKPGASSRSASSSVTLSTSTSELKLLRVLQTLQALCADTFDDPLKKKPEAGVLVTEELVHLLRAMKLEDLWEELSSCLKVVQVLEGVSSFKDEEDSKSEGGESNEGDDASGDEAAPAGKKLKNSAAGLLTRFLPSIEAFFVANASATREIAPENKSENKSSEAEEKQETSNATSTSNVSGEAAEASGGAIQNHMLMSANDDTGLEKLVGGQRLVKFAAGNKVLLNALVRNNPSLLDKALKSLVQVPRCRLFLDFDVKRHWFKTQVRRLRQHASRHHGSLRLHIRRKHVFEDAYHQLRLRHADEMRGRLHITFRNEEGVDAGGLSREFFGILAKEIFNPDYALFTSTEDGCTFQPNPNSNINPDHLSYFRFVGRIVGKAVADGFLLDAHFTRSLYKHMLGIKPTHHDMEAIDPDYYRNLKTILEYKLEDIGLDLTFSIEDHSFGRSQVIDLIPDGRNIPVTEERKAEYVSLVCQHRMTTAISSQIKAYLDGFYELVSPELIAIFNPRELELLISGLPDIDVHDLKKNTDYVGWKATDKEIEWFWNVMFSLSRNEKAAFLQFVTGSSKVPLAGFAELQGMRGIQKFSIHKQTGASGALMSAHTCFNSLDLPVYRSEEELKEKLLYAINEGGGAFLFA